MRRLFLRAYDLSMETIKAVILNRVGVIPQRAVSHNPPDPDGQPLPGTPTNAAMIMIASRSHRCTNHRKASG